VLPLALGIDEEHVEEQASELARPELIPDPVLPLALSIREEDLDDERAEPAIAAAPETPASEPEPESIPDPVLPLVLSMGEEHLNEQRTEPPPESAVPAIAAVPETPAAEAEPDLVPSAVLPLALAIPNEPVGPIPPAAHAIVSSGQAELPGLTELAVVIGSSVDIGSAEDTAMPAALEPATPLPPLQPQWQALHLETAPAALALVAPPLRPLTPAAPQLEPLTAAAISAPELAAFQPTDAAALAFATPIPTTVPVPAVPGKPEAERAFSRPAPALPLAPLQDYTASATRQIRPVPPSPQILTTDAGPRITLPGPALPAQLHSLQNAGIASILADRVSPARKGAPGWLIATLLTVLLVGVGMFAVFEVLPRMVAGGNSTPPVPVADKSTPKEVEASTVPPLASYPLSKTVEVTGFRFSGDAGKKPEVHYVVVNHSSAGLDDMTIYVTLRASSAKPGQPPLSRFSFRTTSLGPFESKEMTSPIEKLPRAGALPEWQDLRADVQLGQ
jgi:hypothetical protein